LLLFDFLCCSVLLLCCCSVGYITLLLFDFHVYHRCSLFLIVTFIPSCSLGWLVVLFAVRYVPFGFLVRYYLLFFVLSVVLVDFIVRSIRSYTFVLSHYIHCNSYVFVPR
jgi:hypothetical protein